MLLVLLIYCENEQKMLIFHILAPINVDPVPAPQYQGPGTSSGTQDPGISPGPADIPTLHRYRGRSKKH